MDQEQPTSMQGQAAGATAASGTSAAGSAASSTSASAGQATERAPRKKDPTYDDAQIQDRLKDLPGWYLEGGWIRRQYKTDGWPTTLMLVGAIGYVAEAAYHHPDLEVSWGKVVVRIRSHEAGGVTDKCLALARKIEEIALWRPAPGDALTGTPNKFVRGE